MLEQRQPTKSLDDRCADVAERITVLSYLPKYPTDPKQFAFICRRLAVFMETVEVNHTHPDDPKNPQWLGWINPLEWCMEQVADTFSSYFPAPIAFRRIYETRFTPLDGKTSAELESVIE